MEIGMTVVAERKCEGFARLFLLMAFRTGKRFVLAEQREAGAAMIKTGIVYRTPTVDVVASGAVWAEAIGMRIAVAGTALGESYSREFRVGCIGCHLDITQTGMALGAGDLQVQSCERILGFLVVERSCRFPRRVGVARLAFRPELAAVFIEMTTVACGRESLKCAGWVFFGVAFAEAGGDVLGSMAVATLKQLMCAGEIVTGKRMVKGRVAVFPIHEFKIATMVLDMAVFTYVVFVTAM